MAPGSSPASTELDALRREVASLRSRIAELEAGIPSEPGPDGAQAHRLPELLLQLPLIFYRVGSDGRFRDVLGPTLERLGVHPAELVGRSVLDIFPEATTAFLQSQAGNSVWSETSGIFNDHPWAALSFVRPVDGDDGTVGVSLDVTEWRESGRKLANSERLFRSLAETVAVAISRNDPLGWIVYANEPMGQLLGVPPADLIGRNSLEFVHEADRTRVADEWLATQAAGENYAGIFRIRSTDGSTPWVMSRSVPEMDEEETVTGFVASLVDITERKQVEEDLSRRVAERTEQLVRANKELEAFCYSVSHDLRAPLRSIDGFCRLLAEELAASLQDSSRDYLARVLAATARMDGLIDDFLSLSRASLGEISRLRVDLTELARGIADELRQRAPRREVRFEIAPGLSAPGDPTLLRDALGNLLENSFKFTARTSEACIEFFGATSETGEATFVVRDNGAGFDMQQASKLFTAFHRLHDDRDFEGTGVGLATVERIIQRHGGRIWAEAEPGRGASFMFTLPGANIAA